MNENSWEFYVVLKESWKRESDSRLVIDDEHVVCIVIGLFESRANQFLVFKMKWNCLYFSILKKDSIQRKERKKKEEETSTSNKEHNTNKTSSEEWTLSMNFKFHLSEKQAIAKQNRGFAK